MTELQAHGCGVGFVGAHGWVAERRGPLQRRTPHALEFGRGSGLQLRGEACREGGASL